MDSSSSVPTGDVPATQSVLPKRKRGRPKKMPSVAMDMIAQSALNDIRGALGMEQPSDLPMDPVTPVTEQQQPSSPVKRGPGRPRKHPLQADPTDNNIPPVKRGRGRPKKVPITTTETEPGMDVSENVDAVSALIVAPPEVMPESGQVSITHVPTSTSSNINLEQAYSHAPIPLVAISIDQPELIALLPSVGGVDMPSDNVPAKRKRGRPKKHPFSTDPVQKKEPEVRPQSNNHVSEKLDGDTSLPAAPIVKRGPGRPKKTLLPVQAKPVPSVEGMEELKKKRGRPRKHPLPTGSTEKRPRGRPRKYPKPDETDEPVTKKKPGRPKKNPVSNNSPTVLPLASLPTAPLESAGKRKRGRPKKNTAVSVAAIPAQSSEPVVPSFPTVALVSPHSEEQAPVLNASSDASRSGNDGFQLILSSSDSEPAESDVANAIATLEDIPRKVSPLLDERFVESSDEDD